MSETLTAPATVSYLSLWRGDILVTVRPPLVTMKEIARDVAERHNITVDELRGSSRCRSIAYPRQEAMWLMRQVKWANGVERYSYPRIAKFLNRECHTTVLWGVRQHQKRLEAADAS